MASDAEGLRDRLRAALPAAMKARDAAAVAALRSALAAIDNAEAVEVAPGSAGQHERVRRLRAEADVLGSYLAEPFGPPVGE